MKASDVMTSKPHTIDYNATLLNAAQKMQMFRCGALPVVNATKTVGILSLGDIVRRAVVINTDVKITHVHHIMTIPPIYCYEEDLLEQAFYKMYANCIRRILIKDLKEKLTGILTLSDIVLRIPDKSLLCQIVKIN